MHRVLGTNVQSRTVNGAYASLTIFLLFSFFFPDNGVPAVRTRGLREAQRVDEDGGSSLPTETQQLGRRDWLSRPALAGQTMVSTTLADEQNADSQGARSWPVMIGGSSRGCFGEGGGNSPATGTPGTPDKHFWHFFVVAVQCSAKISEKDSRFPESGVSWWP